MLMHKGDHLNEEICVYLLVRLTNMDKMKYVYFFVNEFFWNWGFNIWMFVLSLIFEKLSGDMRIVGINAFLNSAFVLFFLSSIGKWIDSNPRIKTIQILLVVHNVTMLASIITLLIATIFETQMSGWFKLVVYVSTILESSVSFLTLTARQVALKDWIVILSDGSTTELSNLNAWQMRVNLFCVVLSPFTIGQMMTSVSWTAGCVYVLIFTIIGLVVQYIFYRNLCRIFPRLNTRDSEIDHTDLPSTRKKSSLENFFDSITKMVLSALGHWKTYYKQTVFFAGFALSLLYLTVMGFDPITLAYAYSQGLKENLVAISQGAAAVAGLIGTIAFQLLMPKIGLLKTGVISLCFELTLLILPVISIWLPGSPSNFVNYKTSFDNQTISLNQTNLHTPTETHSLYSISTFLTGVVIARSGLYSADLTINQIIQENTSEKNRGVIFGCLMSMNQLFDIFKNILVIILPKPETFGILIIISWLAILSGLVSFLYYYKKCLAVDDRSYLDNVNEKSKAELIALQPEHSTTRIHDD